MRGAPAAAGKAGRDSSHGPKPVAVNLHGFAHEPASKGIRRVSRTFQGSLNPAHFVFFKPNLQITQPLKVMKIIFHEFNDIT